MVRTKTRASTPPISRSVSSRRGSRPLKSGFISRQVSTFLAGAAATLRQASAGGGGEKARAAAAAAQRKAADKLRATIKAGDDEAGRRAKADAALFGRKEEEARAAANEARQSLVAAQATLSAEAKALDKLQADCVQRFTEAAQKLAKARVR